MTVPAYISGDFWRICERCGFKYRASQTFKTWDGLWVCRDDFETRHPQDFVRGRVDTIAAPDPRPESIISVIGPLTTTVTVAATAAATTISVESSARFAVADRLSIMMTDGNAKTVTVQTVPTGTSVTLTAVLGASVAVGALVANLSAVAVADIG